MTEYNDDKRQLAVAMRRYRRLRMSECFDSLDLDSRPTGKQQQILDAMGSVQQRYVVAGNQSGKSQLGAREVSWVFEDNHPRWKRPERWGDEPLLIIVVGRTTKQYQETLWRKIKAFLDPAHYREHNSGGFLQKVTHLRNGNTILFASHHSDREAQEKLQSYVAHYVWVDEMPGSIGIIEELHRRCQSRGGYFLATFTPKVKNDKIRKLVDAAKPPFSEKYQMAMFDNPVLTDEDKAGVLASLEPHSESYRNTVLYGTWSAGEEAVYDFNPEKHVSDPENYSKGWRHVLSVDPAMRGKLGFTLWAEEPLTGKWYCIRDDYISGCKTPVELVDRVERLAVGYNIVRRIFDPHEVWFSGTASQLGKVYLGVHNKTQRKHELIKNLQAALGAKIFVSSWCDNLIDEFVSCRWSETAENKIINSSRFHLLDAAQYFVDLCPRPEHTKRFQTHDQWLREANKNRKEEEAKQQELANKNKGRKQWRIRRSRSW